jgi:hypothetical protein
VYFDEKHMISHVDKFNFTSVLDESDKENLDENLIIGT